MRASRVQAASKYGHAFSPHSVPSGRMSARSPFAPTIGALAPTRSDKLGNATKQDALSTDGLKGLLFQCARILGKASATALIGITNPPITFKHLILHEFLCSPQPRLVDRLP